MFVRHVDESLFVPEGVNASIVQILAQEHIEADALESLQALHSIAHVFQYMENPAHDLIRCFQDPNVSGTSLCIHDVHVRCLCA